MSRLLITGAGGSAATNVIDSLRIAQADLTVIACDSSSYMLSLSKGDERYLLPHASEEIYLDALTARIMESEPDVLLAQPDQEVTIIANNTSTLSTGLFFPDKESIAICADKSLLNGVLENAQIPIPKSIQLASKSSESDLDTFLKTYGKSWVRARRGAGSRASLPVSTAKQAIAWISWWNEEKALRVEDFMVSEFLPGREYAFQAVYQNGRLIAGEARERVEYLFGFMTPSGQSSSPSVAKSTRRKDIYDIGISAIEAVSQVPHGVYGVDIKENRDGTPCVTEINAGRFYTTSHFFARAGVNMPDLAFRASKGEDLKEIGVGVLEEGLTWIRMMDMGSCLQDSKGNVIWRSK